MLNNKKLETGTFVSKLYSNQLMAAEFFFYIKKGKGLGTTPFPFFKGIVQRELIGVENGISQKVFQSH